MIGQPPLVCVTRTKINSLIESSRRKRGRVEVRKVYRDDSMLTHFFIIYILLWAETLNRMLKGLVLKHFLNNLSLTNRRLLANLNFSIS